MKITKIALAVGLILAIALACHKSSSTPVSTTSVNIIHAMAEGNPIIPIFSKTPSVYYSQGQKLYYGNAAIYSPLSGSNPLSIVPSTDTLFTEFSITLNLAPTGIYSLFLAGDTTKPDTLFIQDNIPYYTDSSAGVRFVNMSPGSLPISVNIQGNSDSQTEFSNLSYKTVSAFKKYIANSTIPGSSYTFEVRDLASGNLLTTYIWSYTTYRSNTLVISGSEATGSSTPLQVFSVNNY